MRPKKKPSKRPARISATTESSAAVLAQGRGALGAAAGAGVALAAQTGSPEHGILGFLFGLSGVAIAMAIEGTIQQSKRNAGVFIDTLVEKLREPDVTTAEVRPLAEHAKEPAKAAAISEAVKRLLDAPSRQAAPALAILLGETLADERPVGAFFRGAARLFADLDDEEFEALRSLLDRTLKVDLPETHAEVHLTFMPLEPKDPESPMDLTYLRPSKPTPSPTALNDRVSLGPILHGARLFHLLKAHGLGQDAPFGGHFSGRIMLGASLVLGFDVARRLARFVHADRPVVAATSAITP